MIKKIKVEELRPGMFIHDFNCSWLKHPFFGSSAEIKNKKAVEKIINSGIYEVYIDTDKGLDVIDAPTKEEVNQKIQTELDKVVETKVQTCRNVLLSEEVVKAKEINKEAKQTVRNIMEDVRFGRPVEKEKVEHVVEKIIKSIFRNQDALLSLVRIKKTDEYTYEHSIGVCVLMISFGKHLGFSSKQLKDVGIGAMLHDIGKMKVPQKILKSKRPLSDKEYNQMKEHVVYSRILLEQTHGISDESILLAAQHHERIDGTGYPDGLKGDKISNYGQTAAITDVYDAMTSERCYQHRFLPTEVLRRLYEWGGFRFNKELVQQFICCVGIYPVGSLVRLKNGLLAVVINNNNKNLLYPVVRVIFDTKKQSYIKPYDIDLSQTSDNGSGDRIETYESQDKWRINPEMYL